MVSGVRHCAVCFVCQAGAGGAGGREEGRKGGREGGGTKALSSDVSATRRFNICILITYRVDEAGVRLEDTQAGTYSEGEVEEEGRAGKASVMDKDVVCFVGQSYDSFSPPSYPFTRLPLNMSHTRTVRSSPPLTTRRSATATQVTPPS